MRLDFINRVCQSRWTCTCCVGYHQFGRFRWIDANFVRTYVRGWKMGCVDGCSEEATHPPLLPRTTFAEKCYNMEYRRFDLRGGRCLGLDLGLGDEIHRSKGWIYPSRTLACLSEDKAPSDRTLDSDDRSPFRLRGTLRSFVSTDQQRDTSSSLGNILPCVFYRGATIVRSGISIG